MKITIDIPEGTKAAFINLVYYNERGGVMRCHCIDSTELIDGAEVDMTDEEEE